MSNIESLDYSYTDGELNSSHSYLVPAVLKALKQNNGPKTGGSAQRLIDLGCGNGSVANVLAHHGYQVIGVDASESGIAQGRQRFAHLELHVRSVYEDLASQFGQYHVLVSLEVVEHLYDPRKFAKTAYDLLEPGGRAIISTPFHGYWKNLALAITGRFDQHYTALWDGGHIKFWSERTLRQLLHEAGFRNITFIRVGRIRPLAKSMIAIARKPELRHDA
jgi:2-polyprenyl-3-methyl-5-hydroxy-6-metoxy-1,4-benzoquinol methylase